MYNVLGTILKFSVIAVCIIWQYITLSNFSCFQLNDCYIFLVPMQLDSVLGRLRRRLEYVINVKKVICSPYRPGVAQRVGRDIALIFHDRGTRRG